MQDPTYLYDVAVQLQQTIIDCYDENSITLPSRHVISEGPRPAHDCEALNIALVLNAPTYRGQQTVPCFNLREATFSISIVRCTSTPHDDGSAPTPEEMAAFSSAIYTDAFLLPFCISEISLNPCSNLTIGPLTTLDPSGGLGGVVMPVTWVLGDDTTSGS